MKQSIILIILFVIGLLGVTFKHNVYAQSSTCIPVQTITSSVNTVEAAKVFQCTVTVDPKFAGSPDIACGISYNGEWPEDNCPSDYQTLQNGKIVQFFGGWKGNTATFHCVVPNTNLTSDITSKNLVAYDFRSKKTNPQNPECGPYLEKGAKSLVLNFQPAVNLPSFDPLKPQGQASKDQFVRSLIQMFLKTSSPTSSPTPVTQTITPATTTTTLSQTLTPSPLPTTASRFPAGNTTIDDVRQLVDDITAQCGQIVRRPKAPACMSSVISGKAYAISAANINEPTFDGCYQCVGFVQAMVSLFYPNDPLTTAYVGSAWRYSVVKIPGWEYYKIEEARNKQRTIKPGDLLIFSPGSSNGPGHVAFVLKGPVLDGEAIEVAQANVNPDSPANACGHVSTHKYPLEAGASNIIGILTKL